MQTFVCWKSLAKTMATLDDARLGKQRAETLQILAVLRGETDAYQHHPAVRMWDGFEEYLVLYGLHVSYEWRIVRKCNDSTWGKFIEHAQEYGIAKVQTSLTPGGSFKCEGDGRMPIRPAWLDDPDFIRSHRSNLITKLPGRYGNIPAWEATPLNMPYLWPQNVRGDERGYRLRLSKADQDRLERGERELPEWLAWDPNKLEVVPA